MKLNFVKFQVCMWPAQDLPCTWEHKNWRRKFISSLASTLINIRWIRTDSEPYWKIIYSIVLQTIFHEY